MPRVQSLTSTSPYPDLANVERLDTPSLRDAPRLGITRSNEFPMPVSATAAGGIALASGAFLFTSTDLARPGLSKYLPLDFTRGYSDQAVGPRINNGVLSLRRDGFPGIFRMGQSLGCCAY